MSAKARGFLRFWYDFVVGDDWRVALGVVVALGVTYALSRTSTPSWWIMPITVVLLLTFSLWRATKATRNIKAGE
jgi:hypothetical protein